MRIDWTPSSSRIPPSSSNVGFEPFSRRSNEIRSRLASLRALRLGRESLSSSILRKARRTPVALKCRLSSSVYTQQRLFLSSRAGTSWHSKSYAVLENNRYKRKRMNRNSLRDIGRRTRTWNFEERFARNRLLRVSSYSLRGYYSFIDDICAQIGVLARRALLKTTAFEGALANNSISDDWRRWRQTR